MAIADLTGTTWLFNDTIIPLTFLPDKPAIPTSGTNQNIVSLDVICVISYTNTSSGEEIIKENQLLSIYWNSRKSDSQIFLYAPNIGSLYTNYQSISGYSFNGNSIMEINSNFSNIIVSIQNGNNVTNEQLINWFQANATKQSSISFKHFFRNSPIGSGTIRFRPYTVASPLPQLATPANVSADGTTVSWDEVENATSYAVFADGSEIGTVEEVVGYILKAGTYKFIEKPVFGNLLEETAYNFSFTSNNSNFTYVKYGETGSGRTGFMFDTTTVYVRGAWVNQAYRTVTIGTDTQVSDDFYNWAIVDGNLVKQ